MVGQQTEGSHQKAQLKAIVAQRSVSGANWLQSSQKSEQETQRHGGSVAQKQEGKLSLVADQTSSSGKQQVQMHQAVEQEATAYGPVLGGSQDQVGDLFGDIDQRSAGQSQIQARQDEDQDAVAPRGSRVAQTQNGPLECCTKQEGNPGNRFDITQNASQEASQARASQREVINGSCISSGNCDVNQQAQNNVDRATNSCKGHVCFIFIVCTSGEDEDDDDDDDDEKGEDRFYKLVFHEDEGGCRAGSKRR
jgi:hypothetical protein